MKTIKATAPAKAYRPSEAQKVKDEANRQRNLAQMPTRRAAPAVKASPVKKSERVTSMTVSFNLAKETKGALRYEEDGFDADNMDATAIGTLYMRKAAFPDGDYPKAITITITV